MSSSLSDRLGSLSKDNVKEIKKDGEKEEPRPDPAESHADSAPMWRSMSVRDKRAEKRASRPLSAALSPTSPGGLIQRSVIIQRDEKGYGLTVSGDNPVFVQSVKENGAAARAGVKTGDRIIKVNGSLVTNSNHIEVVKLIKSGSYVSLTLLGRPPGSNDKPLEPPPQPHYRSSVISPSSERITAPLPVNAAKDQEFKSSKIATIRMMYEQALNIYEKKRQEYERNPTEKLQQELAEKNKTVKALEAQLHSLTGSDLTQITTTLGATSPQGVPPPSYTSVTSPAHAQDVANDNQETAAEDNSSHSNMRRPTPWLPGGPKHRKHDSMPEPVCETEEMASARDVTVGRSHSDSKKRKLTPTDSFLGFSEKIDEDRAKTPMLQSDNSTPTKENSSPQPSPTPSPVPGHHQMSSPVSPTSQPAMSPSSQHHHSDIWMEDTPSTAMDTADADQSPQEMGKPMSSSPTQDMFRQTATLQVQMPNQANVISVEDDEFSTDDEHLDDHGVFADLGVLKNKPAHMAVFLYYLTSNSDPSPLLFNLVTDSYTQGNMKEMRKWAYEIHSTFLADKAPLRVNVDQSVVDGVDAVLATKYDKEDALRCVFQAARSQTLAECCELLADFRNKRSLGLGSLYGDHELHDENMDRQAELRIVEKYLMPHLENLLSDNNASDRNTAMASALATFLRQVGVSQSRNNILERCPSFNVKDKKMFKFPKSNKKIHYTKGHHFIAQHYYTVTYCALCQGLLWGIGNQGFVCMNCECNIHKNCFERIHELCPGRKRKERGKSIMDKIITRKPSSNNPAAIMAAMKQHEDAAPKTSPVKSPLGGASVNLEGPADLRKSVDETDATVVMRAPSRVGKLVDRFQDIARSPEEQKSPSTGGVGTPRSHSPVPSESDEHRKPITLNRSESLNRKKEKESRHAVRRTRSDVQVDELTIRALDNSGSSSNSSLSAKSLDSPSNSTETVNDVITTPQRAHQYDDSDFETESELPPLDAFIPKDVLRKLKPKEKKRQEVINELFYTERAHVRNLKVMQRLFMRPMEQEPSIQDEFVRCLFPNLDDMIDIHSSLNTAMKQKKRENPVVGDVADILLNRFSAEAGEVFKNTCAVFCRQQSHSLEMLKSKSRKEQKFEKFLSDIESHPLCRRLQLKDLIPTSMQRLTKYPLLIENLMKYTQANTAEHENLQKAMTCSKSILNFVNQAVKDCENLLRLADMQRRLDVRPIENSNNPIVNEYRNLDLTAHKLVYDGPLTWRIGRSKQIDIHVILLEDILVLLQKQDEKLVLKCHSTTVVTGKEDTKSTHSPIIKLANLLTRNVATDKKAFFLVSTSVVGPQIYELVALSSEERRRWFKHITETAETYKKNNKDAVPTHHHHPHRHRAVHQPPAPPVEKVPERTPEKTTEDKEIIREHISFDRTKSSSADSINESVEKVEVVEADQSKFISPSEVAVTDTVLQSTDTVTGPLDLIKTKDRVIRQALQEKQQLVAEVLQLPVEDFENVAEMAAEVEGEKDARELVLASILQTNRLSALLSDSIRLPDDTSGEQTPSLEESSIKSGSVSSLTLPPDVVLSVTSSLNSILTQLLGVITSQDEEKERLSSELRSAREHIQLGEVRMRSVNENSSQQSRPNSFISVTSSASDMADLLEDAPQVASSSDDPAFLVSPTTATAPFSLASHMTVRSDTAVSVVQESDMVQLQEPVCVQEALLVQEPLTVHAHDEAQDAAEPAILTEMAHVETGHTAQVHVTDINEELAVAADNVDASVRDRAFMAETMLHSPVDVLIEHVDLTQTAEEVHIAQRVFTENDTVVVQALQETDSDPVVAQQSTSNTQPLNTDTNNTTTQSLDGTISTDNSCMQSESIATCKDPPTQTEGSDDPATTTTTLAAEQSDPHTNSSGSPCIPELTLQVTDSSTDIVTEDQSPGVPDQQITVIHTPCQPCPEPLTIGQATETESSSDVDLVIAGVSDTVNTRDESSTDNVTNQTSSQEGSTNPQIYVQRCSEEPEVLTEESYLPVVLRDDDDDDDDDDDKFEDCEQEPMVQTEVPSSELDEKHKPESTTI